MRKTDADLPLTCGERQPAGKRGRVFFRPNEETGDGDAEGHRQMVQPDRGYGFIDPAVGDKAALNWGVYSKNERCRLLGLKQSRAGHPGIPRFGPKAERNSLD